MKVQTAYSIDTSFRFVRFTQTWILYCVSLNIVFITLRIKIHKLFQRFVDVPNALSFRATIVVQYSQTYSNVYTDKVSSAKGFLPLLVFGAKKLFQKTLEKLYYCYKTIDTVKRFQDLRRL